MNLRELFFCLLISTLSINVFGSEDMAGKKAQMKKEMLAKKKQKMMSRISERISILESKKSCISSASSKEAMKSCHEKTKGQMQALKSKYNKKK